MNAFFQTFLDLTSKFDFLPDAIHGFLSSSLIFLCGVGVYKLIKN